MSESIPKRIIQTSKNLDLSLFAKASTANITLLNPDFEYLFFTDEKIESFLKEHFKEYLEIFYAYRYPIQRIDFFRYLAIYHYGGFYFDLDVFLATGLEDLLDYNCVFPFEELTGNSYVGEKYGMDWAVGNYAFGAAPGHPFLGAIIRNCVRAQKDPEWEKQMLKFYPRMLRDRFYVFSTTGPGLVSRTLAEYPGAAAEVKILFPQNVCDPKTWHRFGSYGVHLMEGSWLNQKKGIFYKMYIKMWDKWMLSKVLKEGIRLGENRKTAFQNSRGMNSNVG